MPIAVVLSCVLSLSCAWAAFGALRRVRRLERESTALAESNPEASALELALEQRLAAKELGLSQQLARRVGLVLSRVCLALGTGLAVFILASERSLPHALLAFTAGAGGWVACQHVARSAAGLLAGARRARRSAA